MPPTNSESGMYHWAEEEPEDHLRLSVFIQLITVHDFIPLYAFAAKNNCKVQ